MGRGEGGEEAGGRVELLINNHLKFHQFATKVTTAEHKSYESLFISLTLKKSSPVVGVIYRPPGQSLKEFNEEFDELLSGIKNNTKEVILLGDFNIDLLKINDRNDSCAFHNYLTAHHFLPIITRPTRITSDTSTLIDNIFSNAWSKLSEAFILISDISDHLPLYACFSFETILPIINRTKKTRIVKEENLTRFKSALQDESWDDIKKVCDMGDTNGAYDLFFEKYSLAYNSAFPVTIEEKKHRDTFKKPWMTPGLLKSCKKKQLLHTRYIKNPTLNNKKAFTQYRNKFKTVRLNAERNYYTTEFFKHHNDLKATWKLLRAAMHIEDKKVNQITLKINGLLVEDPEIIANSFNNYFVTIASELSISLPESTGSFEEFLPPSRLNSMGFPLTSPEEILEISTSIKKTHTRGLDDIDPYLATPNIHLIANILSAIINCSLTNGTVPSKLKMAKVVPIFKKGDAENPANYRPISVLPYFAKYFEKIVYVRLSNYINTYNLIHQTQHGFQQGHSTYMALLDMEDRITKAIDANEFAVGIFIDLAKAFDTVDHTILLKKLENLGIRGSILKWFHSYFQDRTQKVMCNDVLSEGRKIQYGVPQGSNLGPLLFLLFINDLANVSKKPVLH